MQNLKRNNTNEAIYKTERLIDLENELMIARGQEWGEEVARELGIPMFTLLYLKVITNKDLLYSTGNSA